MFRSFKPRAMARNDAAPAACSSCIADQMREKNGHQVYLTFIGEHRDSTQTFVQPSRASEMLNI
jgi:hypothetical protein